MKCIVIGCRRHRLPPRGGITFATCADHTRMDFDTRPEWVRRMQARGLPAKDLTASI